jgi:hypothetical protein
VTISGRNNVVYRNEAAAPTRVDLTANGAARVEVLPPAGTSVAHERLGRKGGTLSLDVPPRHRIEVDVLGASSTMLDISIAVQD